MNQENRIKDPYYKSLTRKMLFIFIAVSIAPLITVSGIILNRFSVSYNEKLNAHLGELVLKHRQNIDGFLLEKLNNIKFMATSFTVDELKNEKFLKNNLAALQTEYGFKITVKKDSLFSRIDNRDRDFMEKRLKALGYLTIHTRQIDMIMARESTVNYYKSKFKKDIDQIIG